MANLDPGSLSGGKQKLFSLQELIPEIDEIGSFLDSTRDERLKAHQIQQADINHAQKLRGIRLPASSQTIYGDTFGTLLDAAEAEILDGRNALKNPLSEDERVRALASAQKEFKSRAGLSIQESLNKILKGRNYGGYGGFLAEENIEEPQRYDHKWHKGLSKHGMGSGQYGIQMRNVANPDDFLTWTHSLDKNWQDFKGITGQGTFKARGAQQIATMLEPWIVNSDVLLNRFSPKEIQEIARKGLPISGTSFFDATTGAPISPQGGRYFGVSSDLVKLIDAGKGTHTMFPSRREWSASPLSTRGWSSEHVSLEGFDPVKAAKIYTGQKLGQYNFAEHDLGRTIQDIIARYKQNPPVPLDQPLRGGIGHWGGWLTSPMADYRAASEPELVRAIAENQLIQESPAVFDSKKPSAIAGWSSGTIRPDYLGPNYTNRAEMPWNYAVNSSAGGAYQINAQPALWETYLGSDAQRYPSSYVKIGSYGDTTGKNVLETLAEDFSQENKRLGFPKQLTPQQNSQVIADARTVLRSNPLFDELNGELLNPGVRENPVPLATQIAEGHSINIHSGDPVKLGRSGGTTFGLGLHMGIHSGIPANPAMSQTYGWLAAPQEGIFKGSDNGWNINGISSDAVYSKGAQGQIQVTPYVPSQNPIADSAYKDAVAGVPNWERGLTSNHPTFNLFQTIAPSADARDWTAIGETTSTTEPLLTIAPPSLTGSRFDPIQNKWAQGFRLSDYPARAFLPIDPNNPSAGWREAFSNFEKFGLGELSGEAKSWNELEPFVLDYLKRTPNLSTDAFDGTSPAKDVDSLERLKKFFKYNSSLVDREAWEIASKGVPSFEQRFGFVGGRAPGGGFLYSKMSNNALTDPSSVSWNLRKDLPPNIAGVIRNHGLAGLPHLLGIQNYDQLNSFIQGLYHVKDVGFIGGAKLVDSTDKRVFMDDGQIRKFLHDITVAMTPDANTGPRANQAEISTPNSSLAIKYLQAAGATQSSVFSGIPSDVGRAELSGMSANSPKAAILASKDLTVGTEFFNEEQKRLFKAMAGMGNDETTSAGKEMKRQFSRPGFARLDAFKGVSKSFVNVFQGMMPSQETRAFANFLAEGNNAEKFTQNMVQFSKLYPQLSPDGKQMIDAYAKAKLGQKFFSFVHKAGTAMAVVHAPIQAKGRQDVKMARWQQEIDEATARGESLNLSEREIMTIGMLNGVISGLENVPNFLTFGEYDAAMGYAEHGLFSGLFSGISGILERKRNEGADRRRSPYYKPGFKTVNNAGTRYEEEYTPEPNELLLDLTQ